MTDDNKSFEKIHRENEKLRQELANSKKDLHAREMLVQEALIREQKILDISRILNSGEDFQATLENMVTRTTNLLHADAATMDISSADGKTLYFPISFQLPEPLIALRHLPRGDNLSWEKIENGHSLLIPDYPSSVKAREEIIKSGVHGILGVPIMAGKTCLGSLVFYKLDNESWFTEIDLMLAEIISLQTGTAVQNDLLHDEIVQLRGVDPITKLYSQSHFSDFAQYDIERVFRYGSYSSVIMVEIDNLDQINISYGEGIVNQILGEVAILCCDKLRTSDILGSFGQDRMLFLLPEADSHHAQLTAERVRKGIESAKFDTDAGPITLTASLGIVSTKRGRKIDAEKLIRRADQVLASAIKSGRNQLAVWDPEPEED